MASPPTKSHENLQSDSKGIQRLFIPKASNAFRSCLSYSKQLALVSVVTSLLLSFLAYIKVHALVAIFTSAKDGM
jgi:hypothetical protein